MSTYLLQGAFALPGGRMVNYEGKLPPSSEDMALEISWGLWEVPDSDNDSEFDPPAKA